MRYFKTTEIMVRKSETGAFEAWLIQPKVDFAFGKSASEAVKALVDKGELYDENYQVEQFNK